jgi:hypothetical protein
MLRYRCPHCSQILQAHELRAGKKSVCNACLKSHMIPADRAAWLTETGEPQLPRKEVGGEPEPTRPPAAAAAIPAPVTVEARPTEAERRMPESEEPAKTPNSRPPARAASANYPATTTPPPASSPTRLSTPRPVVEAGAPKLENPVHVDTQADIAAALTEALTLRMKPPRRPRRDLRLSTAAWMFLTGIAAVLILVSLFSTTDYSLVAILIGLLEVALGYGWIVSLTARRDPRRGLACAVPPVTVYYLMEWKYAKLRPLRFVITGAIIAGFASLVPSIHSTTRAWVSNGSSAPTGAGPNPADFTKLEQLRDYRDRKSYDKLIDLLRVLRKTDAILSEDAKNRAELAAEMKALCTHSDTGVKIEAMAAYARWGGDDAREICLKALGQSEDEKLMALSLLPQWKGTEAAPAVATAVAALIVRPGRVTSRATAALEEIGGSAAEDAARDLLFRSKEQSSQLVALDILEKVGGPETIKVLVGYANTIFDQAIKTKILETIEIIRNRPKKS